MPDRPVPGAVTSPVSLEWRFAPDHMYAAVAALADRPAPGPTGEPTAEQWNGLVRRVVDLVWSTGWMAGAAHAASLAPAAPIVIPLDLAEPFKSAFEAAQTAGDARTGRV